MINDSILRNDIINYIKNKSQYKSKSFIKHKSIYSYCDTINDYWTFISELKSGIKYKNKSHNEINDIKDDPTNIFYWIIKWKDEKLAFLKKIKPHINKIAINQNYLQYLLSYVPNMIPIWLHVNNNINLFVIKITIPSYITIKERETQTLFLSEEFNLTQEKANDNMKYLQDKAIRIIEINLENHEFIKITHKIWLTNINNPYEPDNRNDDILMKINHLSNSV
jgi:hypothetical protein